MKGKMAPKKGAQHEHMMASGGMMAGEKHPAGMGMGAMQKKTAAAKNGMKKGKK